MLDLSRSAEASDPRDHIYGFIGLYQPDLSKLIAPNYEASMSDVFRDFALSVIEVSGELDILYHGRKGNALEKSEMPSWVLDWSQEPKDYVTILDPVFQAAGKSKSVQGYSENKNLLKSQGFLVDLIDGHGCNCYGGKNDIHDVAQPITLLQPYKSPDEIKEALWNAILGGRKEHDVKEETYKLLLNLPWLSRTFLDGRLKNAQLWILDRFQQCNRTVDLAGQTLPAYFPNLTPDFEFPAELSSGDPSVTHDFSDIAGRLLSRKLFTTWRGYIGMGPPNVQQGDRVYILLGCSLPVVLRPCGDKNEKLFKLVGECYIHSIMHEEALE